MALTKLKARSGLAAEIAGIDIKQFNDAVADGFYPCAPQTMRGKSRVFDVNDILALFIYRDLINQGMVPRHAGDYACGMRRLLQEHPEAKSVVFIKTSLGSPHWVLREDFNPDATHFSGLEITYVHIWHLENRRNGIIHQLEETANILGSSDNADIE